MHLRKTILKSIKTPKGAFELIENQRPVDGEWTVTDYLVLGPWIGDQRTSKTFDTSQGGARAAAEAYLVEQAALAS